MAAKIRSIRSTLALLVLTFGLVAGLALSATAAAHHSRHRRRRHHPTPTPTPTPKPTPTAESVVLIAGGSGIVQVAPAGENPAVLDSAEIYDPGKGQFFPIYPMTTPRDRHIAAVLHDGKVLVVGGVDTVMTPLSAFPGPAMPWIL